MPRNLRGQSFVKLMDHTQQDVQLLLELARDLKRAKYSGVERPQLVGKNIALIFEKSSTRTRCAFEVAAYDQGAHTTYLGPSGSQMGHKESIRDTARVLGRMYDAIEYRGFGQVVVEELAEYAGVPVYNGLTDEFHPTQVLADLLTMQECTSKPLSDISYCYVGDARNNMGNSLAVGGSMMGMDVRICAPQPYLPSNELQEHASQIAADSGARLLVTDDLKTAVSGVDFVYTDVWVSMGETETVWDERIKLLKPYQVNAALMDLTENSKAKFMHCLPAFHDQRTKVGKEIGQRYGLDALEVTDEVFESAASVVFQQAENRMHTIKALLVATLA